MEQEWKIVEPLLTTEQMGGKCRLFAKVSILPGHELAPHDHHGETETYYILSGRGIYDDNGVKSPATLATVSSVPTVKAMASPVMGTSLWYLSP